MRPGRLYRADALSRLAGNDWERFTALGVRTVIDLRYPLEIDEFGRVPDHDQLQYFNFSIEHRPYDQASLDPDVEPARFFADRYAEVAADGVKEIRQTLAVIADHTNPPVVFHCKTGKDRTGLIAALVLHLLGVRDDDIVDDFALTNLATDRFIADARAAGIDPRWPGYGTAPADTMRFFLADLTQTYGSVRGYIRHLGMDDDQLATTLRDAYI